MTGENGLRAIKRKKNNKGRDLRKIVFDFYSKKTKIKI